MMNDYNNFLEYRENFVHKTVTESPSLRYLKWEAEQGHINTDMDMQRNYVWTAAQEQEMWDTLLLGVRIPELHAIIDNDIWNICDGKQRLTCIFNILNNNIPFEKRSARPELKFLFEFNKTTKKESKLINKLFYKDLPKEFQSIILNTTLYITKYTNLTRTEQITLFRKINNGTALSNFAKGLSSYYYMRTDYTYFILKLPQFNTNAFKSKNQEDLESTIIRILILSTEKEPVDLQPINFEKYYPKFENINYIVENREKIIGAINKLKNLDEILKCKGWVTGLPFLINGFINHDELTSNQAQKVLHEFTKTYKPGRGSDLGVEAVRNKINFVEGIIKNNL